MSWIDVIKENRKKSEVQKQVDYFFKIMIFRNLISA